MALYLSLAHLIPLIHFLFALRHRLCRCRGQLWSERNRYHACTESQHPPLAPVAFVSSSRSSRNASLLRLL
ncbi:hypothetical protein C8R47DRAFT_1144072 [Mycena vitilis]|nr:hypothetical protein C8R47DRAFT_1144072 [Mycena vitilis]